MTAEPRRDEQGDGGTYHLPERWVSVISTTTATISTWQRSTQTQSDQVLRPRGHVHGLRLQQIRGVQRQLRCTESGECGLARSGTSYVTDTSEKHHRIPPGLQSGFLFRCKCTYSDTWSQIQVPTENYNLLGRYTQRLASDWQSRSREVSSIARPSSRLDQETPSAAATRESFRSWCHADVCQSSE